MQASASKCIALGEDSQAVLRLLGKTVGGLPQEGAAKRLPLLQGVRDALPGTFGRDIGNLQVNPGVHLPPFDLQIASCAQPLADLIMIAWQC